MVYARLQMVVCLRWWRSPDFVMHPSSLITFGCGARRFIRESSASSSASFSFGAFSVWKTAGIVWEFSSKFMIIECLENQVQSGATINLSKEESAEPVMVWKMIILSILTATPIISLEKVGRISTFELGSETRANSSRTTPKSCLGFSQLQRPPPNVLLFNILTATSLLSLLPPSPCALPLATWAKAPLPITFKTTKFSRGNSQSVSAGFANSGGTTQ